VWRRHRPDQAAAKVEALVNNGMDEIEIPEFLRKQAD
jgi:cell division protein FtsZ